MCPQPLKALAAPQSRGFLNHSAMCPALGAATLSLHWKEVESYTRMMSKLFGWLPKRRWKRWLVLIAIASCLFFMLVVTLAVTAFLLWRNPGVQGWVMVKVL